MELHLRVFEQVDDDAEQAENTAGGNQAASVERAGTDLTFSVFVLCLAALGEPADQAAGKDSHGGGDGQVGAHRKGE